jgi:hypothetical protein
MDRSQWVVVSDSLLRDGCGGYFPAACVLTAGADFAKSLENKPLAKIIQDETGNRLWMTF